MQYCSSVYMSFKGLVFYQKADLLDWGDQDSVYQWASWTCRVATEPGKPGKMSTFKIVKTWKSQGKNVGKAYKSGKSQGIVFGLEFVIITLLSCLLLLAVALKS